MPPPHEFFGEIGNDPLRSAVQARRAAFGEGAIWAIFIGASPFGKGYAERTGRGVHVQTRIAAAQFR